MAYTVRDFKTKKELREAVLAGEIIRCYQPGLGPDLTDYSGKICLEGPHYPKPHSWYAEVVLENGVIKKVR